MNGKPATGLLPIKPIKTTWICCYISRVHRFIGATGRPRQSRFPTRHKSCACKNLTYKTIPAIHQIGKSIFLFPRFLFQSNSLKCQRNSFFSTTRCKIQLMSCDRAEFEESKKCPPNRFMTGCAKKKRTRLIYGYGN